MVAIVIYYLNYHFTILQAMLAPVASGSGAHDAVSGVSVSGVTCGSSKSPLLSSQPK